MKRLLLVMLCACGGRAATPATVFVPKPPRPTVASPASVAPAELTGVVKKLRVSGATRGQRTQIESALAAALSKPVASDELRAGLATAIRVEGVDDLVVQGIQLAEGIELVVEVAARPVLKRLVAIETGGKAIALGISAPTLDGPLDPRRVQALAQTLRDRYVTNGYFDADATWKTAPVTGGVEVTIEVTPGELSAIDAITFPGSTRPKQDLEAVVAKWLVLGQPVVEERIAAAVQALNAYYWDRGYANVLVREPKVTAGRITLAFTIIEGPVFRMGGSSEVPQAVRRQPGRSVQSLRDRERTRQADRRSRSHGPAGRRRPAIDEARFREPAHRADARGHRRRALRRRKRGAPSHDCRKCCAFLAVRPRVSMIQRHGI